MVRSKYAALGRYLLDRRDQALVPMSFSEIERLVGTVLPNSKRYPAWWSNNPSNNPMTKIWLAVGFRTEQVNIAEEKLVFANHDKQMREIDVIAREAGIDVESLARDLAEEPREFHAAEVKSFPRHPAIGALKGTFIIDPGYDVTKPAMDADERTAWETNLMRKVGLYELGPEKKA